MTISPWIVCQEGIAVWDLLETIRNSPNQICSTSITFLQHFSPSFRGLTQETNLHLCHVLSLGQQQFLATSLFLWIRPLMSTKMDLLTVSWQRAQPKHFISVYEPVEIFKMLRNMSKRTKDHKTYIFCNFLASPMMIIFYDTGFKCNYMWWFLLHIRNVINLYELYSQNAGL